MPEERGVRHEPSPSTDHPAGGDGQRENIEDRSVLTRDPVAGTPTAIPVGRHPTWAAGGTNGPPPTPASVPMEGANLAAKVLAASALASRICRPVDR